MRRTLHRLLLAALLLVPATLVRAQDEGGNSSEEARQAMREAVQRIAVPQAFLTSGPNVRAAFRDVVNQPSHWTARVLADGKETALGVVVGPDGWILTKASQLQGHITCTLADGKSLPARIVGVQKDNDLAMLKIEARRLPVVAWINDRPAVGQWVATPGVGRDPVSVGVIGTNPREIPKQSGVLGIMLEDDPAGAKIMQIVPESGAAAAGLLVNDIVTACNGKKAANRETLIQTVRGYSPGDEVELTIIRDGKEMKFRATLADALKGQKPDRRDIQNTMGGKLSNRRLGFPMVLTHDSTLRPEDCGGPLVDLDGHAVGLNIARGGRTETYAVPADVISTLLVDLMSGKLAPEDHSAGAPPEPSFDEPPSEPKLAGQTPATPPAVSAHDNKAQPPEPEGE